MRMTGKFGGGQYRASFLNGTAGIGGGSTVSPAAGSIGLSVPDFEELSSGISPKKMQLLDSTRIMYEDS